MFRKTHPSTNIENEMSSHAYRNTVDAPRTRQDLSATRTRASGHDEDASNVYSRPNNNNSTTSHGDVVEVVDLTRERQVDLRPQQSGAEGTVSRRVRVDSKTNARQYYENDGKGTRTYGYYYNSDNDPNFRNQHGDGARAACYYYSSTSTNTAPVATTGAGRGGQRGHVQVREATVDDGQEPGYSSYNSSSNRNPPSATAQPIVEEPDDEDDARGGTRATPSRTAVTLRDEPVYDPFAAAHQNMVAMMRQQMQDMHSAFFGRRPGGDPFFDDMDSFPFGQRSRQRARLFGDDPFARFFRD